MVKEACCGCMIVCAGWTMSGEVTNVFPYVSQPLTENVLQTFPRCSNVTVSSAFLGFVRGSVTGDLISFLSPMSDELRLERVGCSTLEGISTNAVTAFSQFVREGGFTNVFLSAYAEIPTNGNVLVKTTMVSSTGSMVKTNNMALVFGLVGAEWRITAWDVEE